MTVAEYIIDFFIDNQVTDVFGYQGGMIAYLFEAMGKRQDKIQYHECATEQGGALAACGYAQATGKMGIALTTSGPGFTNLITGMANAWFDSIPLICISGQVNTKDKRRNLKVRQLGFQEIQAPKMAEGITKKVFEIDNDTDIAECMQEAWSTAMEGRKGPVFLELPINICRNEVDKKENWIYKEQDFCGSREQVKEYLQKLQQSRKPVIIAGAGIHQMGCEDTFRKMVEVLKIPVITTLPALDLLPTDSEYRVGYLGGTARREAGIVLSKTDCVLAIGTRLCAKSIGYDLPKFAPNAKLFRVDIDEAELERTLKDNEVQIKADLRAAMDDLIMLAGSEYDAEQKKEWVEHCGKLKKILKNSDVTYGNTFVEKVTGLLPDNYNITLDVGNNMIYGAQSSVIKEHTRMFVSGGFGTMGYALPAAVGTTLGNGHPTCVITGDGGMQMNIQELNIIGRKQLPVKIIVLNNRALGHIKLFQKAYLQEHYFATDEARGDYFSCDFTGIAEAYGIEGHRIGSVEELDNYRDVLTNNKPVLIELIYEDCGLLPNIHGGCDCLTSGPQLDTQIIQAVRELGF